MTKASSEATVQVAIDRFLASARCRNPNTRRSYAGVLDRFGERLGADRRLDELAGEELAEALEALWGGLRHRPRTSAGRRWPPGWPGAPGTANP